MRSQKTGNSNPASWWTTQAILEFPIDRRKILTELNSQLQQLIIDDDELVVDLVEAVGVFMAANGEAKWCQGKIKELQRPSTSGAGSIKWQSDNEAPQEDPFFIQL